MNTIWDKTDNDIRQEIAKGNQSEVQKQTLALLEMLKLIGEETQKNKSVSVENIIRQVVGEVSVTRPDWIKELIPNSTPLQKKLDYIASAIIRKEVVRKMDINRPAWLDEIKPKEIIFPLAKDYSKPTTDLLEEVLQAIKEKEITEQVEVTNALEIKQPKWWKLPDIDTPIVSLANFIKKYFDKATLKTEVQNEITVANPVTEVTIKNPQKEVKISNLDKIEKNTSLMTAQLRALGTTGSSGGATDVSNLATEETLQALVTASGGGTYKKLIDDASPITYIGEAVVGSATSSAVWRVKKVDETNSPDVSITYAGTGAFDQVYDNRVSLTYS